MSKTKNDVDMFERNYTQRGFRILTFHDTNENNECSLQESSDALNECVWLGISKPDIQIMYKDALAAGLNLKKKYPETNECGWCDLPLPEGTLISSRMHLTREQARKLAHELFFFGRHGYLDCKEGERISEHGNKAMKKINEIILEPQSNLVEPSFPYQQNYVENGFEYFSYIAKIPMFST